MIALDSGIRATVNPSTATVATGANFQFTATLTTDTTPNDVTWLLVQATIDQPDFAHGHELLSGMRHYRCQRFVYRASYGTHHPDGNGSGDFQVGHHPLCYRHDNRCPGRSDQLLERCTSRCAAGSIAAGHFP